MFQVFLPIVKIHINFLYIFLVTCSTGIISGMIGIGGGFLMIPTLIFLGVPPSFAIANGSNAILSTSVSGTLNAYYKKILDFTMGYYILSGALFGALIGTFVFKKFIKSGLINEITGMLFFILLTTFGIIMLYESIIEIYKNRKLKIAKKKRNKHYWIHGLPLKVRMHTSRLYTSIIPPIFFGFITGLISALLGIGGAFILMPLMIYALGMSINTARGTALFVVIGTMTFTTLFHSIANHNIDLVLILLLLSGSLIGVQIGTKISNKLKNEEIRFITAIIIVLFGLKFGKSLFFAAKQIKIIRKIEIEHQINIFSKLIYEFARNHSIIYGLTAVFIAIFFGFLTSYVARNFHK
jgi:uncharacterized protein